MPQTILTELLSHNAQARSVEKLLASIRRHLDMDVAFIGEFTAEYRIISKVNCASSAADIAPTQGQGQPLTQTYCHHIVSGNLPEMVKDTSRLSLTRCLNNDQPLYIGAYIAVPMRLVPDEVYGTLCCYSRKADTSLSKRDVSFLRVAAELIGTIIKEECIQTQQMNDIRQHIQYVIEQGDIDIAFQPIVFADGRSVDCYEALLRIHSEPYQSPDIWIKQAESAGCSLMLETAIIQRILAYQKHAIDNGVSWPVAINVSPEMVFSDRLSALLNESNPDDIRLEITEHVKIDDYPKLSQHLEPLLRKGFRVVIDDAGAGFSSLKHILELNAATVKLDRSLIQDVHVDTKRQAMVAGLVAFTRRSGLTLVAEGVEIQEEYDQLQSLGVEYFQGFYFARPLHQEQLFTCISTDNQLQLDIIKVAAIA